MNARLLILSLALALIPALTTADDKKPEQKKAAAKSTKKEKNVFQKTESNVGDFADKHNIWNRKSATAKKN
jgi:hypothetical protein